jgi:AcrR family transcriptional regulator
MASTAPPRTRSRSADLGEEIVDAAERLLRVAGDEGFTIQQLVDEAGVALQTFYRHFASKDQLLLALLERSIAEFCTEMRAATAAVDDPVERIRAYVTRPLRLLSAGNTADARVTTREHFRLYQLYPAEVSHATSAFTDLVLDALDEARRRELATSTDSRRDAWMITELVMTTFHHYAFTELGPDGDAVVEHLWQFCRNAIGSQERGR